MTSEVNKAEYDNLQGAISGMEAHLTTATDGTRQMLNNFINNAKGRLAELEKKMEEERKAEVREKEMATAAVLDNQKLVEQETALNGSEKETYGKFLAEEFFTKKDFNRLEHFYSKTWDRLSEDGKAQMSQRVWGGISRGEYTFGEMPDIVQKDESKQLYLELTGKVKAPLGSENILAQDKADFIREYEAGDRKAVSQVLSRKSFAENLGSRQEVSLRDTSSAKETNTEEKTDAIKKAASKAANCLGGDSLAGFGDADVVVKPDLPMKPAGKDLARGSML